jgi:hypothetical protein
MAFPREKPAGKYEAGFWEGDENLFRRCFGRPVGEGRFSKIKGLAALAVRRSKKLSGFAKILSPFWR